MFLLNQNLKKVNVASLARYKPVKKKRKTFIRFKVRQRILNKNYRKIQRGGKLLAKKKVKPLFRFRRYSKEYKILALRFARPGIPLRYFSVGAPKAPLIRRSKWRPKRKRRNGLKRYSFPGRRIVKLKVGIRYAKFRRFPWTKYRSIARRARRHSRRRRRIRRGLTKGLGKKMQWVFYQDGQLATQRRDSSSSPKLTLVLTSVKNNFWATFYNQSYKIQALKSAGQFPGTAGSRRGTPFAAGQVVRWAASYINRVVRPMGRRYPRPRPIFHWRYRFGFPRWRWWQKYARRKLTLQICIKNWFRGRLWRHVFRMFRQSLRARARLKIKVKASKLHPHNGMRAPKKRRV